MKNLPAFKPKKYVPECLGHNWCHIEGMMSLEGERRLHWFVCSECGRTKEVLEIRE